MKYFSEINSRHASLIATALVLIGLLPWMLVQAQMRVPDDAVWLSQAAGLFLSGAQMTEAFFDNNPPMSYMVYAPVVWLTKTGLPLWYSLTAYGLCIVLLGLGLSFKLVAAWQNTSPAVKVGVIAAYAVSVTLLAQYEFAQKDHLIAATLFPFLLAQFALTYKLPVSRGVVWGALALGTPFLLLKPHYGLLPAVLMGHRLWQKQSIVSVFKLDFLFLATGFILYGFAVAVWFPDYLTVALPYAFELYASRVFELVFASSAGLALLAACLVVAAFCLEKETKRTGIFLSGMALVSVAPFFLQMKGLSLHMLPSLVLMLTALTLVLIGLIEARMRKTAFLPVLSVAVILGVGYLVFPPNTAYPTHNSFTKAGLALYLHEKQPKGGFFMQADTTTVVAAASLYSGVRRASRFPGLWFLPFPEETSKAENYRKVFGGYIAADLKKFKPEIVAVYAGGGPVAPMPEIFGGVPAFDRAWQAYRRQGQFTLDYAESYGETDFQERNKVAIVYDIYVRSQE